MGAEPTSRVGTVSAMDGVASADSAATTSLLAAPEAQREDLAGHQYGSFRLMAFIGEGGMGVVYRAERVDGVTQSVAVKLISTTVGHSAQARFEREAQLLAQIEHAAVARLVDAGVKQGRAWIAMEYVDGLRIDDYCAEKALSVRDIVGLLVQLADALAVAHRMLVVHNDIKPANVLMTSDGSPKLIDFGISKVLQAAGTGVPGGAATVGVGGLFSPGFAAPEQINGGPVTVATDVFGLGALAYRLLTGRSTFADAVDPLAYLVAITRRDVELPSRTALKSEHPEVARQLRGDMDAILCKALNRDPRRRYASAIDMQKDLQRYLERRPVKARAATPLYRLSKFVRRNPLAVGLVGLTILGVVVAGTVMAIQSHRTALARDMGARRAEFIETLLESADPGSGKPSLTVPSLLDSAAEDLDRKLGGEPLVEASMLGLLARTNLSLGRFAESLAASDRELGILRAQGIGGLELGRALTTRGLVLTEMGKWSEALPPLQRAVSLLRKEPVSIDLCKALNNLGVVLAHSLQETAAEASYREAIAIESHGDAELRAQRVYPLHSLTILLADLGRYSEAVSYGHDALNLAAQIFPATHPDLLSIKVAYADSLNNAHRSTEAEPLLREVIASQSQLLGPEHKATLLTELVLARSLSDQHRDAEAAAVALSAAHSLDAVLGAENLYALSAWSTYGIAACNSNQEHEGLEVLHRVATVRQRIVSTGNWLVPATNMYIGRCLYKSHRYAEAEPTLLAATSGLEATRGPTFNRTQDGYRALGALYAALGRPEEAASWNGKLVH